MNYYLDRSLYVVRRIYRSLTKSIYNDILSNPNAVKGQEASDLIYEILSKDEPCMISRFGSTELETIMSYLIIHNRQNNIVSKYIEFL